MVYLAVVARGECKSVLVSVSLSVAILASQLECHAPVLSVSLCVDLKVICEAELISIEHLI